MLIHPKTPRRSSGMRAMEEPKPPIKPPLVMVRKPLAYATSQPARPKELTPSGMSKPGMRYCSYALCDSTVPLFSIKRAAKLSMSRVVEYMPPHGLLKKSDVGYNCCSEPSAIIMSVSPRSRNSEVRSVGM